VTRTTSARLLRLLVIPAVCVLSACGGNSAADHLGRGDKLLAEGKLREAVIEYRAAVQADDRNAPARQKLGRAFIQAGDVAGAYPHLVRAADLLPNDASAQVDAAAALLAIERFEDARTRAEKAIALDARNVDAHIIRASAAGRMRDVDTALSSIDTAIELDPTSTVSFLGLARLQASKGESAEAEAAFKQAIAVGPTVVPAYLAFAKYYRLIGKPDAAEQVLRSAVAKNPSSARANLELAALLTIVGKRQEAEAPLKQAAALSKDPAIQLSLADFYVSQKRDAEARPLLEGLSAKQETRAAASARLAAMDRTGGNSSAAYARLSTILEQEPNNAQILAVRSGWLLGDGRISEALTNAESATRADARVVDGWLALGSVHLARNDDAAATKAFQEAIRLKPADEKALVALAGLSIRAGNPSDAVTMATQVLDSTPNSGSARYMLSRALLVQGKTDEAQSAIRPLLALKPPPAVVLALQSQILQRRGDAAGARRTLDQALSIDPKSDDARNAAIALELSTKNVASAVKHAEAAIKATPDRPQAWVTAGRTYAMGRDFAKAEQSLTKALQLDPSSMEAYRILGQVFAAQNRLDDAKRTYETQLAKDPNDVAATTMVGMIAAAQGDLTRARGAFEKAVAIDPRAAVASNNLAYLDADAGTNLDVALNRAQTAKAALPDDPVVDDTLGWVYVKRGLPALAITPLGEAIKKDKANPVYHYHLGVAYAKAGDKDNARSALQRALQLSTTFPDAADARRTLGSLGN
jgi:tetratricopeptide (TPR) repeat protein